MSEAMTNFDSDKSKTPEHDGPQLQIALPALRLFHELRRLYLK